MDLKRFVPQHSGVSAETAMEQYYRERAPEYDQIYQIARRQDELLQLKTWLTERVRGRTILEIAAGTGYWTEAAASVAKAITATDCNSELLQIASKRSLGPHVTFRYADAYTLPDFSDVFDAGMAMLWWSHVEKQRHREFLAHFTSRLRPGALVLMIDQIYVEAFSSPVSKQDEWGNLYTLRNLVNGSTYEIVKNYPSDEELRGAFAGVCEDVRVVRTGEFWTLSAQVRT